MKTNIKREMKLGKFQYKMTGMPSVSGSANYTLGIALIKVSAETTDGRLLELRQTNWLLKAINVLPILNICDFTPFEFYKDKKLCGRAMRKGLRATFAINTNEGNYEIRQHNDNFISLMRNEKQIALYKRDFWVYAEGTNYSVDYDETQDVNMIFFMCIFADAMFGMTHGRVSLAKYEKHYVLADKWSERTKWRSDALWQNAGAEVP